MIRVVLVSLLVLAACKKKDSAAEADPPAGSSGSTASSDSSGTAKPTGDKRVSDSTNWATQTGPGFTVKAPGAATIEKVAAADGDRAFDRYTFHKADLESYVVEITELPESEDVGMELGNMRMRIAAQTQAMIHEDMLEGGEVTGRDIWYVIDQGDDTLRARSKLLGKGHKLYQVRGVSTEDKARQAEAEAFVDSFAFTP
ncbi:MAG: hypothetical protein AB7T06_00590 [Kofleriaceae bacterium]